MRFSVVWKPQAEADLAEIWLQADHRQEITDAANRIDAFLKTNAVYFGQKYDELIRILVVRPLAVYYQILESDRTVVIARVWRTK